MAVTKVAVISAATKLAIKNKSVETLPDRPSDSGYKPETIKKRFFQPITDATNSIIAEMDRIVGEMNDAIDDVDTADTTLEADKLEHSALEGTAAEILAGITKDTIVYTKLKTQEVVAANGVDDKAYTDTEVGKIVSGTYIADKATKDGDGNVIPNTYVKPVSLTDGTITVDKATKDANGDVIADTYLKKTGGTMSGAIAMGAQKITGAADGTTNTQDVATVKQVETLIANAVSSVYKRRGSVATYADLAAKEGTAVDGDVWEVLDTGINYAWVSGSSTWDDIGGIEAKATAGTDGLMSKEDYAKLASIESDTEARLLAEEVATTDHETRIGTAETEIDALQANIADLDDANLNESHSRMSPALLGTITNGTPVTDAYWNGRLNEIRLKGLTLSQLIKNGNFVTAGNWTVNTNSSNLVASSNVLSFTAGNASNLASIVQSNVFSNTTDVYFVKASFKVDNALCINVKLRGGSTAMVSQNTPSANTWYDLVGVATPNGLSPVIEMVYNNSTDVNGKVMQVKNVVAINLTALGTHPTLGVAWSTLTAEQVSAYIGNYKTNSEILADTIANGGTTLTANSGFDTNYTSWNPTTIGTPSVTGGIVSFTASAQNGRLEQTITTIANHIYYVEARVKVTGGASDVEFQTYMSASPYTSLVSKFHTGSGNFEILTGIGLATTTSNITRIIDRRTSSWSQIEVDYIRVYDITDSARTSGLYSFKPTAITSTDGTITRSLDLSGLGRMNSVPSGIKDEFDTYVSTDTGERVHEHTLRTMRINLPTGSGWTAGTVGASFSQFYIDLGTYDGGQTLTLPADDTDLPDAFQSIGYVPTAFTDFQTLNPETPTVAGSCITPGGIYHIVLPNATADTISELYTYLAANPILIVIGITEEVETNVIGYLKQTGTAMTIEITSDTFVLESGFSVKYVKDLQTVIDGIIASIPA